MATISYKCPNCDGELKFNPAGQNYTCEYCGSAFSQAELDAMTRAESTDRVDDQAQYREDQSPKVEVDGILVGADGGSDGSFIDEDNNGIDDRFESVSHFYEGADKDNAVLYSCPSCGAEIVTDQTTAATFCYYCHNPVVLGGRLEGDYLPNLIVPFQFDRKQAEAKFFEFVSKKRYVPKGFFKPESVEKLSGVYFPYWLYEVELQGYMEADAENVRTWTSGNTSYREVKRYRVLREGDVSFKNRVENALRKANADLITGVLPYDTDNVQPFNMGYLSGFLAEKRDIEVVSIQDGVRNDMRNKAEAVFKDSMSYSNVRVRNNSFRALREDWRYVLLPVWTMTYQGGDGKRYYFSLNGQSGKVYGKLPVDRKKLLIDSVIAGLIIAGAILIGGLFL